jgi:excinuclease UvrABC nuclease subunit
MLLDDLAPPQELPDEPGIYLVTADQEKRLYVGHTVSLRRRIQANFSAPQLQERWRSQGRAKILSLEHLVTNSSNAQMLGLQSCMIGKYDACLNFRELRVAE